MRMASLLPLPFLLITSSTLIRLRDVYKRQPQQSQNKFGSQFSVKPQQSPVKPVQPGMGTRPYTPVSPAPTAGTKPVAPAPNYTGIHKPGNLRSNVEEKSLKIPDFLQKK